MKQVEVTILGQSYLLACPDDGREALLQAVAAVDREMSAIRDAGKVKARERMAVLAALNLAYRLAERDLSAQPNTAAASMERGREGMGGTDRAESLEGRVDVQGLIRRLDEVLAEDGRLL
jgi:cell division protein ZapA